MIVCIYFAKYNLFFCLSTDNDFFTSRLSSLHLTYSRTSIARAWNHENMFETGIVRATESLS